MQNAKKHLHRLLGARQLLRVLVAQAFSTYSNQVVGFVTPWLVLNRTGSALDAGSVAFAVGMAAVVGTLFGGVIVDRIGSRKTSIIADLLSLVTVLMLPFALWMNFVPLWLIIVTQMLGSLFDGPGMVAKDTLVPQTAKQDKIPLIRATSVQESLQAMAMFIGPLSAGVLIALVTESVTLLVVAAMFIACVVLVLGLKKQVIRHDHPMTARKAFEDMREGLLYIVKEPLLGPMTILSIAFIAVFVPLTTVVFPAWFVFANVDSASFGLFLGVQSVAWILGGFIFAAVSTKLTERRWLLKWLLVTNVLATIGYFAVALTYPGSPLSIIISFLLGGMSAGWMPIFNTAYYSRTPEALFGRVNGVSWAASLVAIPFVSLFLGWLVSVTSPVVGIMTIAAINLALTVAMWLMPSMRLIDAPTEIKDSTDAK